MKPSHHSDSKRTKSRWRGYEELILAVGIISLQVALLAYFAENFEAGASSWLSTTLHLALYFLIAELATIAALRLYSSDGSLEESLLVGEMPDKYGHECERAEAAVHQALLEWKRGEA